MRRKKSKGGFGGRTTRMRAPRLGELEFDANGYAIVELGLLGTQPIHKRNVLLYQTVPVTLAYDALRQRLEERESLAEALGVMRMNGEQLAKEIAEKHEAEEQAAAAPEPGQEARVDLATPPPMEPEPSGREASRHDAGLFAAFRRVGRAMFGEVKLEEGATSPHVEDAVRKWGERFEAAGEPPVASSAGPVSCSTVPICDQCAAECDSGREVYAAGECPVHPEPAGSLADA